MSNTNIPIVKNKSNSFSRNESNAIVFKRNSFQQHHGNSSQISAIENSPRSHLHSRYSYGGNSGPSSFDPNRNITVTENQTMRIKPSLSRTVSVPTVPKSTGLVYSTYLQKEFSSIDKINDPNSNGLICAGKSHLGYYKFSEEDKTISLIHNFTDTTASSSISNAAVSSNLNKRHRQLKLSTIADVKTGFNNYKNYVAICAKSTVISIYDINKAEKLDKTLITSYSEHTRAVNSFDFNMVDSNLLISGGQDGCIKIWDLRTGSLNGSTRSDININTASDSIRDVKWMPGYNFASHGSATANLRRKNNSGYKFASIHDSGLLLKFDIRQPSHAERKINAHTGPGLCLNWHPNQDYIVTGGRDGKCCLWYVGDMKNDYLNVSSTTPLLNNQINSFSNLSMNGNNILSLPETTINVGFPVTKLKFRPSYDNNVMNSLLAISSMGDEAAVNIYALGRKYIPKHILLTAAPSQGLVWWNEKLIFNVDRANRINGWNIEQEPTVLDNIQRTVVTWRDMDGSGFLAVNQDVGDYTTNEDYIPTMFDKTRNFGNKPQVNSAQEVHSLSKGKGLESFKKNLSNSNLSYISDKGSIMRKSNSKNYGLSSPLNNNLSPTSGTDDVDKTNTKSPIMVTLDLPHIFNNMRLVQMKNIKKKTVSPEVSAIKESPIQVFQFLARELDFSFSKDRNTTNNTSFGTPVADKENNSSQDDLMKKFGFTNTTTWTNLMTKKSETSSENKSIENQITGSESLVSKDTKNRSDSDTSIYHSDDGVEKDEEDNELSETTRKLKERIKLLIELIEICKHNAGVYSYIDDLPNFKVWVIIRDALLWDLQSISKELEIEETDISEHDSANFQYNENVSRSHNRGDSFNTQLTDLPSEIGSFVVSDPKAFTDKKKSNLNILFSKENALKKQKMLEETNKLSTIHSLSADNIGNIDSPNRISQSLENSKNFSEPIISTQTRAGFELKPLREQVKSFTSSENLEDENDKNDNLFSETTSLRNAEEQPDITLIPKRNKRPSFIDTFMTERPIFESRDSDFMSRSSFSTHDNSPVSKLSSFRNYTSTLNNYKKLSQNRLTLSPTFSDGNSRISDFELPAYKINNLKIKEHQVLLSKLFENEKIKKNQGLDNGDIEPWSTGKILKQLFNQAVQNGNILMVISILTLFQDVYKITTFNVVKDSILQFIDILHRYELFEIAAALLKYCPWDNILDNTGTNSLIQIFCDNCGKLVINERSKEKFTQENFELGKRASNKNILKEFGYWYCESCNKRNKLCVVCEKPMKGLTMSVLQCGHGGHFECMRDWFLEEGMTDCPAGDYSTE
ncbi:hypothetical protein TPHA_0A00380 [Tetrapisispora phaffii CBS 4417]|uniref:Restriction of telomere capping protein 1 n=1 Tax=Tetrapisispora phaffii (strain ATCC 24235 / CBS 4417 / NBRC 1672 / NRRL Y-8282 / UCD 70-5) TaxID=1071381 RepID=G8BMJ5_TETPH|nr:hypothetical protein TPHA_0A00380 [Tetrapisispora phaffii CBS 4417]CCE61123.1 hypothetical protein TPHA_0A00380 [Tetrapisispora phaffii CBS 4417]